MSPDSPASIHHHLETAFNSADLDALVSLYEPGAVLVAQPNAPVTGSEAIREAYRGLLSMRARIQLQTVAVFEAADGIALLHGQWQITGVQPDGSELRMEGRDTEIVRRQTDGRWLFVVDNPFTP